MTWQINWWGSCEEQKRNCFQRRSIEGRMRMGQTFLRKPSDLLLSQVPSDIDRFFERSAFNLQSFAGGSFIQLKEMIFLQKNSSHNQWGDFWDLHWWSWNDTWMRSDRSYGWKHCNRLDSVRATILALQTILLFKWSAKSMSTWINFSSGSFGHLEPRVSNALCFYIDLYLTQVAWHNAPDFPICQLRHSHQPLSSPEDKVL